MIVCGLVFALLLLIVIAMFFFSLSFLSNCNGNVCFSLSFLSWNDFNSEF